VEGSWFRDKVVQGSTVLGSWRRWTGGDVGLGIARVETEG